MLIRRNRPFSEAKNLATSLLIICQKEKISVIFRKNRHASRTCGSAVTALYSILSNELCFVFQDIQVQYVALIVHNVVFGIVYRCRVMVKDLSK